MDKKMISINEAALYRNIVEDSASGVFVAEKSSRRILYMSDGLGKMFHIPKSLLQQTVQNAAIMPQEYRVLSDEEIASLEKNSYLERHIVWKEKKYLSISVKSINWHGLDAYIMYFTDETTEHFHQLELQKLINEVPMGIGIFEIRKGKLVLSYINDAYYEMLKVDRADREKYAGDQIIQAVHPEDREQLQAVIASMEQGKDKVNCRYRVQIENENCIWWNMAASTIERKKDYLKVYVAFSDCTEMMQVQRQLQENRSMLDAALIGAKVYVWKYRFENEETRKIGMQGEHYDLICEESKADYLWLCDHCKEGRRIQKDIHFKQQGQEKNCWHRIILSPVFDQNDKCIEVIGTAVDITEQKEREQRYQEQLRLKDMMAKDALAVSNFNLTRNKVMGLTVSAREAAVVEGAESVDQTLAAIKDNCWNEEERKKFMLVKDCETMLKTYESGESHIEIRHHLQNGKRWMQTSFDMLANPYTGDIEAMAVLRDITEVVWAELVVQRLLKIDYEVIRTIDVRTGVITQFQQENEEETQWSGDLFMGQEELEKITQHLASSPVFEQIETEREKDKIVYKRVLYAYLEENKDNLLCAIQDVTETYEAQIKQKREVEKANESKTEFFARMSHDMRTPMNGILGLAELSMQENDPQVLKDNIVKIKDSGKYLLNLINDTLDFQKIESGKMTLNCKVFYVKSVFDSMIDMIKPAFMEKGVHFKLINHGIDMDWHVKMDSVRVQQIFLNLLSNAGKYTPKGGTVLLDFENLGREGMITHTCIRVIDTGIGMSQSFIQGEIFKPFAQEHNEVTNQYAGSGLGLSIVKSLVEMMGGRIEIESHLGEGTTFSVYLDFERVNKELARKEDVDHMVQNHVVKEQLKGKHILLAEDHPLNAQVATKLLQRVGCKVTVAENGKLALDVFLQSELGEYDAILMDIRMPILNGLEATRLIRSLKRADAGTIPIIAMTANAYEEDVQKSLEAGMNEHLGKPIDPGKIYDTLLQYIGKS